MNSPRPLSAPNDTGKWMILLAIGAGTFMSALDASVVNVVLPVIREVMRTDVASVEWIVTVYLLVLSGVLLSFGRLGDMRGHRNIYLTGFIIFVISSGLCGLSWSVWWLVAFRGVQAVGGAMLFANAPAILTGGFPASERGKALGLQATMTYLGLTVGPALGGFLAHSLGWRSVFYINVPTGSLALWLGWRFIPKDPGAGHERFDFTGAALFTSGLVCLLLALNQGHAWGWKSALTLGLVATSAVLLSVFLWWEHIDRQPMLDLSLFRSWLFSTSTVSAVLQYTTSYVVLFILPFYLIQGCGLDAARAGLVMTAQPLVMAIVAPLSGTLSDRIGTRFPATAGMLALAAGSLMLARVGQATPLTYIALSLALSGLGSGLFTSPNNSALMGAAPANRQGIASGMLATARNTGMACGVGLAGAIFTTLTGPRDLSGEVVFFASRACFLAAAIVAALGAVVSGVRGTADGANGALAMAAEAESESQA
ncbi:MAG: MFS transporter [Armatimonadetes bacterium]|nr:MFS transporter [Armatimonadota bacterium]